jgi:hypothetical protein
MITREQITGAIKVLNAAAIRPRRPALRGMLAKEYASAEVEKVMADLGQYPEWGAVPEDA